MSWPPALLEREWKPTRRRLQLRDVLRQVGETAAPASVDLGVAVAAAARRRRGQPASDPGVELGALRRVLLSESLRGLWQVSATAELDRLILALDLDRVRDLARDPALDPRLGDEGQPQSTPLSWRRVVVVREAHVTVASMSDAEESWSRARWETWASRCAAWLRRTNPSAQATVSQLAIGLTGAAR